MKLIIKHIRKLLQIQHLPIHTLYVSSLAFSFLQTSSPFFLSSWYACTTKCGSTGIQTATIYQSNDNQLEFDSELVNLPGLNLTHTKYKYKNLQDNNIFSLDTNQKMICLDINIPYLSRLYKSITLSSVNICKSIQIDIALHLRSVIKRIANNTTSTHSHINIYRSIGITHFFRTFCPFRYTVQNAK